MSGDVCYFKSPRSRQYAIGTVIAIGAICCSFIYPETAYSALAALGNVPGGVMDALGGTEAAQWCFRVGGNIACNLGAGGYCPLA